MKYENTEWAIQEPVVEADEEDDRLVFQTKRHRWTMPVEKESDDYQDVIELHAKYWHPGTVITISVPTCPECEQEAPWGPDIGMDCDCGFNWRKWWEEEYA